MAELIPYAKEYGEDEPEWIRVSTDGNYILVDMLIGDSVLHKLMLNDDEAIQVGRALSVLGLTRKYLENASL